MATDSSIREIDTPIYKDEVVKVEPYGVEHIPDAERHGKPWSLFTIWFAGNVNIAAWLAGFLAVTLFGLDIVTGILAVLIGNVLGGIAIGILSGMGAKLGVPQQVQSRGPFGFLGNFGPLASNVVNSVGWGAVNNILGAWALQKFLPIDFLPALLIMSAITIVVTVYGYNMIHRMNQYLTIVLGLMFLVMTIIAIPQGNFTLAANPEAPLAFMGPVGAFITAVGVYFSYILTWMPFASDYSRYLPAKTPLRTSAGYTFAGVAIGTIWLQIVGVIVASVAAGKTPVDMVVNMVPGFWIPMIAAVFLGQLSTNALTIYGGALSACAFRIPIKRWMAVILIGVIATAVALWAQADYASKFETLLLVLGYLIAPYVAILIVDFFAIQKQNVNLHSLFGGARVFNWGLVAWVIAVLVTVPFWSQSLYTGPIATAWPELGDVGYYIGFAVALIVYWPLARLPFPGTKREPQAVVTAMDQA
ncbi:MAG: cytosine permease [Chloroflexi bacterium]|nr:cytosine permease [Chloroflexota bacterium]